MATANHNFYVPLPAYKMPDALDFQPLQKGLSDLGDQFNKNRMMDETEYQNDQNNNREDADLQLRQDKAKQGQLDQQHQNLAATAAAINDLPEDQQPRAVQGLLARIPEAHDDLMRNGIDPTNHKLVLGALMRQGGVDPSAIALNRAKTASYAQPQQDPNQQFDPSQFYEGDDGTLQRRPSGYQQAGYQDDAAVAPHFPNGVNFAQADNAPPQTPQPSVVMQGRLPRMSQADVRASKGQALIDSGEKPVTDQDTQNYFDTKFPGARPKGFIWDRDGTLIDLKEQSKGFIAREKAVPQLQQIDESQRELLGQNPDGSNDPKAGGGTYLMTRNIAQTPYLRYLAPKTRQAVQGLQQAATMLAATVEGKRHANAEEVRFLKFFSLEPDDDASTVRWKIDRLRQSYLSNIAGSTRQGHHDDGPDSFKSPKDLLGEAQDAIKRGADPEAVKKQLLEKHNISAPDL